jgi:prophage antirepressor-like protein
MTEALSLMETFEGKEIRAIEQDHQPWVPLVDLAAAWGVKANTLYQSIDRNEKKFKGFVSDVHVTPMESHKAVNEQGLYLLVGSLNTDRLKNKKAAEKILKFQRWVPELIKKYRENEMQIQSKIIKDRGEGWSTIAADNLKFASALMEHNPNLDQGMCMAIAIRQTEKETGMDLTPWKKLIPPVANGPSEEYMTATAIARNIGNGRTAAEVNRYLYETGFLWKDETGYHLTDAGILHGRVFPGSFSSGHNGYFIMWKRSIISASRMRENNPCRIRG